MRKETPRRNGSTMPTLEDAFSMMPSAFQLPMAYARANMHLMQQQLSACSEFAQRCATCQKPEGLMDEYAYLGERTVANYSRYLQDVTDAIGGASRPS